jgi:DNA-binding protein HU-beta
MKKADLIAAVAADTGASREDAAKLVASVTKSISNALITGEEVAIHGFGKFKIAARPARDGRNPKTGESMKIQASKKVSFRPASALKDKLKG